MAYPRRQNSFFLGSDEQPSPRPRAVSTGESEPPAAVTRSGRPPPSSFAFPFQAYPGNPDPGMRVPGAPPRRYSLESLNDLERRRSASFTDLPLPPPNAPFMHGSSGSGASSPGTGSSDTLPRSPSSTSLYKSSAAAAAAIPRSASNHSFRTPFLAPPSRPSSTIWTPPANDSSIVLAPKSKLPGPSTRLAAPLTAEDKPWLLKRQPFTYRSYFSTLFFIFLGAAGGAALCFFGYRSVPLLDESKLCLVMDEQFTSGSLDESVWNREVQLGGFGNGEFQMTTEESDNLFFRNNQLYIHPTLTSDKVANVLDGGNYTLPGCTLAQTNRTACSAVSVAAAGRVINPVMSARINTQGKKSIKYGKVEVRAKLPRGDWLWPAVWMLPESDTYGAWPMSGEIDILEARGNGPAYPAQGSNVVRSSVNYGPLPALYRQIFGWQSTKQTSFDKGFHTYTLEWTDQFMRMYVDKKTRAMLEINHLNTRGGKSSRSGGFWNRGKFPKTAQNGSSEVVVENIWEKAGGGHNAPFDQPFYLIINVAAGGTSGWFPDNKGDKPWYDGSLTAMRDFARNQDTWSATWPQSEEDRSFRVDSVKMWEICK